MSEFDLDSKYGKRALKRFYGALEENESSGGETAFGALSSTNVGEIIDEFIKEIKLIGDHIVDSIPTDDDLVKHAFVLSIATAELDRVGLDRDTRAKADVRMFLNRLSGLIVTRQSLVFKLFMSTLNGVIKEAKSSGEFEGTAEDITATTIEICKEIDLAIDPSSGQPTKLTTLDLDRGFSFDSVCTMAIEESQKLVSDEDTNAAAKDQDLENEEGFIVLDDDDDGDDDDDSIDDSNYSDDDVTNDAWMSNAKPQRSVAESGFYVSKRKITGRYLVLFAKRKFDSSIFKTEEDSATLDPLGLMQLTRPNTGTIAFDKSTRELQHTYRLAFSCKECKLLLKSSLSSSIDTAVKSPIDIIKQEIVRVSSLWERAYTDSDSFDIGKGLAPRRQKCSLVNGPGTLFLLPALEESVQFTSGKNKALKIMRAQIGKRRIVGVRFPSEDKITEKLLEKIKKSRGNTGSSFIDEALKPICQKSMKWALTKRKTMKSFFKVTSSGNKISSSNNNNNSDKTNKPTTNASVGEKRRASPIISSSSGKKAKKTMMSYFAKKM